MKACKKTVLWNANYDREDKDYTNALIYVHVVLNGVIFHKFHMILLYMLDTFYLSGFFPSD